MTHYKKKTISIKCVQYVLIIKVYYQTRQNNEHVSTQTDINKDK